MIKLIDILKEIGDTTSKSVSFSGPFTKSEDEDKETTEYYFDLEGDKYTVQIYRDDDIINVVFGTKTDKSDIDLGTTNKNKPYTVMATVSNIIKDYLTSHPNITTIKYEPHKREEGDDVRDRLYKSFITQSLPDWEYSKIPSRVKGGDDLIYLNKKEKNITEPNIGQKIKSSLGKLFKE